MNKARSLWLLFALVLALSVHLWAQPLWLAGILLALFALKAVQLYQSSPPLSRGVLLPLAVFLIGLCFFAHHSLIGRDGGMALLSSLVVAKLFETRTQRDSRILLMLGFFCIGASFLQSQSIWVSLLVLLSTVLMTMVVLAEAGLQINWRARAGLSGRIVLEALPLAVLLFVFFPRLPGPLWSMPPEHRARSGLSSEAMQPGNVSQLSQDDSIAFRVEFFGPPPSQQSLYWRGPVFEVYDGLRWLPAPRYGPPPPLIQSAGARVRYTITMEPHQERWLLGLDIPVSLPEGARLGSRFELLSSTPVVQRQRYTLESVMTWRMSADPLHRYSLQLPAGGNPRARELADSWRALPSEAIVQAGLDFLHKGGFSYTLDPPLLNSGQQVDEFLFESKQGFCEHYASSFAFLMRAAGVPARIVTGYQGGSYNPLGGYLIVRQADAHAWVEVWLEGRGWQRVDPTSVVSPGRIDSGLAAGISQSDRLPMMLRRDDNYLKTLRLQMDVWVNGWNQWVIGYDDKRQLALLQKLGINDLSSAAYVLWLMGGVGLILGGFALWNLRVRAWRPPDEAGRIYLRFCRKLDRAGIHKGKQEGPRDFAARACGALPQCQSEIDQITQLYLAVRYGGEADKLGVLQQCVARFSPQAVSIKTKH